MLNEVLSLRPGLTVALVGAGGKTTTMFQLAAELAMHGAHIITTTTTHIFPPDPGQTGALILERTRQALLERAAAALEKHRHVTLATAPAPEGKLRGIPPAWIAELRNLPGIHTILVEADGAKGRLIKAPAEHEPVIPSDTNLVLLMASAEALGQPLNSAIAHRPERVAAVTGLHPGEVITPQTLATLAASENGLLKGVPSAAQAILMLTHVDQHHPTEALKVARFALASGRLAGVLLCSLDWAQYLKADPRRCGKSELLT